MWDTFKVAIFSGNEDTIQQCLVELRAQHGWGSILSAIITTWCQHFCQGGFHEIAIELVEMTKNPRLLTDRKLLDIILKISELPMSPAAGYAGGLTPKPDMPPDYILEETDPDLIKWVRKTFNKSARPWVWSLILQTGHHQEMIQDYLAALIEDCEKNNGLKNDKQDVLKAIWCLARAKWGCSIKMIGVYEELCMFRMTKPNRPHRLILLEWIMGWSVCDIPSIEETNSTNTQIVLAKPHVERQMETPKHKDKEKHKDREKHTSREQYEDEEFDIDTEEYGRNREQRLDKPSSAVAEDPDDRLSYMYAVPEMSAPFRSRTEHYQEPTMSKPDVKAISHNYRDKESDYVPRYSNAADRPMQMQRHIQREGAREGERGKEREREREREQVVRRDEIKVIVIEGRKKQISTKSKNI